jgi:hypothetical protein
MMKTKVKENTQKKPEQEPCHHFWVIEVANGPSSRGTCKHCGETREFLNSFPTFNPLKKNANPLNLPKISGVKIDKDSEC